MTLWVDEDFRRELGLTTPRMSDFFAIEGEVFREPAGSNRRTLRFECGGRGYFLKQHWGVGWREIFKNLLSLKAPVLGARNEWQAIQRLTGLGVETMQTVAYGEAGMNPATRRSFVVTRELESTISLEDYCADWVREPPPAPAKWVLIDRVAEMTAALHANGMNHRDLYICHFLLQQPWAGPDEPLHLYLIDLHRMQFRDRVPHRWLVKDLAALYFSALHIGLTRRDLYRFIRRYAGGRLRDELRKNAALWRQVSDRAWHLQNTKPVVAEVPPRG